MLSQEFHARHRFRYLVIDISARELDRAPAHVETLVDDISDSSFRPPQQFDLVLTRWVLEHVQAPAQFHTGVARLLRPGGCAVHFFPTLYAVPFVLNRVLPECVSSSILKVTGWTEREQGKFRAYYRWCRGPSRRQLRRFRRLGFEVEEYIGFFGHRYYKKLPALQRMEDRVARVLAGRPVGALTSYAWVVLRKKAYAAPEPLEKTGSPSAT
jgi:2-polyprenyl-3-methyl-5-hydroxy-6-metoxy-1,4-benzoquinol methylase